MLSSSINNLVIMVLLVWLSHNILFSYKVLVVFKHYYYHLFISMSIIFACRMIILFVCCGFVVCLNNNPTYSSLIQVFYEFLPSLFYLFDQSLIATFRVIVSIIFYFPVYQRVLHVDIFYSMLMSMILCRIIPSSSSHYWEEATNLLKPILYISIYFL